MKILLITLLIIANVACSQQATLHTQSVLITLDDMRPDDMRYMPRLQRLVNSKGVEVKKAFVTCPLCCPSRASLMTGLMPSNNGVISNKSKLYLPTIFEIIKQQKPEIKTGIIGKYLNTSDGEYKSEFDLWSVYRGGMIYDWDNFNQNINGTWTNVREYVSDFYLKQAKEFVKSYENDPYLLYLHFTAPHFPFQSPKSFKFKCSQVQLPSDFNKIDPTSPNKFKELKLKDPKHTLRNICKRAKSMSYIDSILPQFIKDLKTAGVSVIVISDNGFMVGDFRHYSKSLPYEQVIRSPMLTFNHGIKANRLTSFNDIVKEYYKLFGLTENVYVLDGKDFSTLRKRLIVEQLVPSEKKLPFKAIVSNKAIKVTYGTGEKQIIPLK